MIETVDIIRSFLNERGHTAWMVEDSLNVAIWATGFVRITFKGLVATICGRTCFTDIDFHDPDSLGELMGDIELVIEMDKMKSRFGDPVRL